MFKLVLLPLVWIFLAERNLSSQASHFSGYPFYTAPTYLPGSSTYEMRPSASAFYTPYWFTSGHPAHLYSGHSSVWPAPQVAQRRQANHPGLINLGVSCPYNALIQALASLDLLRNAILTATVDERPLDTYGLRMLSEVQKLFYSLDVKAAPALNPLASLNTIVNGRGQPLYQGNQADAHEFYMNFIRLLEEAWLEVREPIATLQEIITGEGIKYVETNGSIRVSDAAASFTPLTLYIRDGNFDALLAACFHEERRDERGSIIWEKNAQITVLPRYLPLYLSRTDRTPFDPAGAKNNDRFVFPLTFNLERYVGAKTSALYRLHAVIMHSGSTNSGHYTTYAKRGDAWFSFNDTLVTPIDQAQVLEQAYGDNVSAKSAYMLFYERVENP